MAELSEKMEILFVENNFPVDTPVTENIKSWGYRVEISGTGKDALRKVRQKRFDLVLLDIFLPDCKGHELIPQLREMWPDIGVVTMTGYNSRELEWEARQKGILYYMIKPFDMNELKVLLDHISKKNKERRWERNGRISGKNGPGGQSYGKAGREIPDLHPGRRGIWYRHSEG